MGRWTQEGLKRRAILTGMAATTATGGCTSWRQVDLAADRLVREHRPGAVRLTRLDSSRVVLLRPRVIGDSLVGDSEGDERRTVVPGDSVKVVAVRRLNGTATALTVIGVAGVVFTALCVSVRGVCFDPD